MSYKTPWRSLGDSNPCFRREREITPSIHVPRRHIFPIYSPFPVLVCLPLSVYRYAVRVPYDPFRGSRWLERFKMQG